MAQLTAQTATNESAPVAGDPPHRSFGRRAPLVAALAGVLLLIVVFSPTSSAGFWSWDWYWIDHHERGSTALGGIFYDVSRHANPVPVEVQWYRLALSVLGLNAFAHHALTLTGYVATLGMLYLLGVRLGIPRWARAWAVLLAGVAPAALTSWTWFAASPHMWAALLGLAAAVAHLTWRRAGSPLGLLAVAPTVLTVLGLAMKNDAVIGPLLILAWEWTAGRTERPRGRWLVSVAQTLPVLLFVWWQATAIDPHRDEADTGVGAVASNAVGLLRFAFLWRTDTELRDEFPPSYAGPAGLLIAGAVVGALVLGLAVVSLRTRVGRVLVVATLASLGPVAVLQPALLSRYVLPPVLLCTLAAGVGAAELVKGRARSGRRKVALTGAGVATVAIWSVLAHLGSYGGAVATDEERALLNGMVAAGIRPADTVFVRLEGSPIEPSTALYRQYDPELPPEQRLRKVRFLRPGESAPDGSASATATRLPNGDYEVRLSAGR